MKKILCLFGLHDWEVLLDPWPRLWDIKEGLAARVCLRCGKVKNGRAVLDARHRERQKLARELIG